MKTDMDSFDYIYYHYGMEQYGNMPLIEELEYREELRVEDFVVALDTSGSCSGELIRRFLEETMAILGTEGIFHDRCHIYVLQCDAQIQDARLIRNREELEQYLEEFQVRGFGGTDFRPVFEYVEKLRSEGMLKRMRGLLYFTDGYGTYPARRPDYRTAFVFVREDAVQEKVPSWAMKLILDEKEWDRQQL